MLEACGAFLGDVHGLADHKGVRERVIKPYLKSIGADPLGQHPLPRYSELRDYPEIATDILGYAEGVDAIKDVKTALIWPALHKAYPDAKWLIVMREPEKIADSCMRTSFMRKFREHSKWVRWANDYHRRCEDLAKKADTMTVWTKDIIEDPSTLEPIVEWLGLEWDEAAVASKIERSKWHG